jgi:hypothetical protein
MSGCCVQEFAKDRPSVSIVIIMLKSETIDPPFPKQLAFTERQIASDAGSSQHNLTQCSVNNVTVTMVQDMYSFFKKKIILWLYMLKDFQHNRNICQRYMLRFLWLFKFTIVLISILFEKY